MKNSLLRLSSFLFITSLLLPNIGNAQSDLKKKGLSSSDSIICLYLTKMKKMSDSQLQALSTIQINEESPEETTERKKREKTLKRIRAGNPPIPEPLFDIPRDLAQEEFSKLSRQAIENVYESKECHKNFMDVMRLVDFEIGSILIHE